MIEEELIYNLRIGNKEALSLLLFIYEKKVVPFYNQYENVFEKNGYDKDDMKAFVRENVLTALKNFHFGKRKFNTYYSTIAYRNIITLYRNIEGKYEEKFTGGEISLSDSEIESTILSSNSLSNEIDASLILDKIKEISDKDYKIMTLYLEGYSYEEIADMLSTSVKSISNHLQKIRFKLRKWLLNKNI